VGAEGIGRAARREGKKLAQIGRLVEIGAHVSMVARSASTKN
jgi:hypothetical protein